MKRLIIFLTAICLFSSVVMKGAFSAPDFNFTHYSTDNGLPSNSVRDIVQDEEGFMWFATDGGLVRFDGTSAKTFVPVGEGNDRDFFMLSLCNSSRGLLVGSDRCLYLYDSRHEKLEEFPLTYPDDLNIKTEGPVVDICVDSANDIWISVEEKGVFRISSSGNVLSYHDFEEVEGFIGDLYIDPSDTVWGVSTARGGGIYKFDRSRSVFEPFVLSFEGENVAEGGLALTCDSHGDYWFGTWDRGLVRFNGRTGEAERVVTPDKSDLVWHIHSITEFSPSMLLVGSDSGLTLVDRNTGECHVYKSDELNPQSLSDRFIYPVVKDNEGGLWIGTYYRGVNYMSRDSQRFRKWTHSRFVNSISGNVISRLCEDVKGNIWVGSADGGLCRFNPETGLFNHFPLGVIHENENINALRSDGDRIWVGTYSKGAGTVDIGTGRWRSISMEGDERYSCYAICKDSGGRVWMGAMGILARYNPDRDTFERIANLGSWITDIDEDRNGEIWISTQGSGLFKFNPNTGARVNYVAKSTPGSLPHNHINSVTVGGDGEVYVATLYGVWRYDREDDCFSPVDEALRNVAAQSIEQSGGDLWIGTLSGLIRFSREGEIRTFTYSDGISDNQFVPGASLHASDGNIYYGTVHGFCCVDPMVMRNNAGAPMLKFTSLDIVNSPVEVGDPRLPESLNCMEKLILTHADHTFSVYFSALSYANPEGNTYKYRLEGFDKSWHLAGKENRASYSNLPPGEYTLRVKAANGDGIWNEEGISLRVVVKPAWYATALMKTVYVLLGLALLLLGVRYVLWRMERNHITELDRISSNKEKEMYRSKLNFFTVVAHEIRTPVSLIIGPLEKILSSEDSFSPSVKEDLNVIDRNARRLLSLVNQLLDFKKVEDNALPVGFRHEALAPLIENVTDRFRPSLNQKGIDLTVDCHEVENVKADVDPEALTKLVSNLLNNARKFTKDRIRVECGLESSGDKFRISVEDNGIGVTKENRDKIFKPFFQVLDKVSDAKGGTGLGLSIVKSVVDAHGGSVEVDSTPGKGSRFTVLLPVHQENVMPSESDGVDEVLTSGVPESLPEPDGGARPVVLVIDDNEEMLRFISSTFEKRYEVVTALNGKEGLEMLAGNNVALIICDWMMPVMDGVELLKIVRNNDRYSHIPFVMLTAKTDNVSKIETMKNGADFYLEKPFSTNYLEACVANLLEMRTLLRKKYSEMPLEPIETLALSDADTEFLVKLQKLIEDNFTNPEMNVDFLADHVGLSRSALYTKIRSLLDMTPNELVNVTRLKRAAALLKEGKLRVNEISYMVGYNSSSYFARCFYKQFGVKPGDFALSNH